MTMLYEKPNKTSHFKPFEELTITDDFMFGVVMSEPSNLKPLLESILNIKIAQIHYPERQKVIDVTYDAKGVRLDVYCEDEKNTVYSIEMQVTDQRNLPKRIRYYHDMIDLNIIDKGENYKELKKSYVIFICCFDPFGTGRYMYTFKRQCQEEPGIFLGDETESIILNVNGSVGNINSELKATLAYMSGKTPDDGYTQTLDKAVKKVKENEKWRRDYMTFAMKMKESNEVAVLSNIISSIKRVRDKFTEQDMLLIFGLSSEQLSAILEAIDANPDMDEWEIANIILFR